MPHLELQIGLNGRFFPVNWRPAREEIAFAYASGFAALQLPGKVSGLAAEHLGDPLTVVRDHLTAVGLTAVMEIVLGVDLDGRTREGSTPYEVLYANLPAITILSCQFVHWHLIPAGDPSEQEVRQLEATLIPQFVAATALAQQYGFRFGLEHNEPDLLLFGNPAACRTVLDAAPMLGFVWDMNHTTPEQLSGYLALIPRMNMLHVSDTPLPEVNHHLPLGMGNIDFRSYCSALAAGGFRGPAILEIGGLPKSGGYGRDTDAALLESRRGLAAAAKTVRNS